MQNEAEIKAKAKELISRFENNVELPRNCNYPGIGTDAAKQCAVIHCDDMIEELAELINDTFISMNDILRIKIEGRIRVWQSVKQSITNQ